MAMPTINDVQGVEPILTNMAVGYMQSDARFIASRIFPEVQVPNDSGTYFIFTKKYFFVDNMEVRAPGADFPQAGFGLETGTYSTLQYALEFPIADERRANSLVPLDLETAAARWLAQQNLIRKERAFSTDFMKTGVWGTDGTVTYKWSDYANSDPYADIATAVRTVSNATGFTPNQLAMGYIVYDRLANHPDMLDRIKYNQAVTQASLGAALGAILGANLAVSKASYNSANEGQTGTYAAIVDDDILVCYSESAPGLMTASAGYTFTWNGGGGSGAVFNVRDAARHADLIQMKAQWDQSVVASDLGYFIADVVD